MKSIDVVFSEDELRTLGSHNDLPVDGEERVTCNDGRVMSIDEYKGISPEYRRAVVKLGKAIEMLKELGEEGRFDIGPFALTIIDRRAEFHENGGSTIDVSVFRDWRSVRWFLHGILPEFELPEHWPAEKPFGVAHVAAPTLGGQSGDQLVVISRKRGCYQLPPETKPSSNESTTEAPLSEQRFQLSRRGSLIDGEITIDALQTKDHARTQRPRDACRAAHRRVVHGHGSGAEGRRRHLPRHEGVVKDLTAFNVHAHECLQCCGAACDPPIGKFCPTGDYLLGLYTGPDFVPDPKPKQSTSSGYRTSVTPYGTVKVKVTRGTDLPERSERSDDEAIDDDE